MTTDFNKKLEEIVEQFSKARDTAYKVPCPHNGKCNKLGCTDKKTWELAHQNNIEKAEREATTAIEALVIELIGGEHYIEAYGETTGTGNKCACGKSFQFLYSIEGHINWNLASRAFHLKSLIEGEG